MIKIYGGDSCVPCIALKKYLDLNSIQYEYQPATGQEYQELASVHGFVIPLVVINDTVVSGLNWGVIKPLLDKYNLKKGEK